MDIFTDADADENAPLWDISTVVAVKEVRDCGEGEEGDEVSKNGEGVIVTGTSLDGRIWNESVVIFTDGTVAVVLEILAEDATPDVETGPIR